MYRNGVSIRVHVNGRAIREYNHNGLSFIEARQGTSYTINVKNDNSWRMMVVVSVDGLDVITGKPAEESNTGYIVEGYSSTEIKGYRISDTESAAFLFVSKEGSYSTTKSPNGESANTGVIGLRAFREKVQTPQYAKSLICDGSPIVPQDFGEWVPLNDPNIVPYTLNSQGTDMAVLKRSVPTSGNQILGCYLNQTVSDAQLNEQSVSMTAASFDTGTSWGAKQNDKVKQVSFKRGDMNCEMVLYYASRQSLESMGIDLSDSPTIATSELPKAFGNTTYCQPPKGWRG